MANALVEEKSTRDRPDPPDNYYICTQNNPVENQIRSYQKVARKCNNFPKTTGFI
ncbi:hypothetical protein [Methanosarcina sp. UBA5]|uniref:hypothetical protein n=1 Tax=Methanosarcina sp. UBA5 TaxID=1915593 RepID=UPI0025FC0F61|nr:hypothetical protein [Methanosarcina sp. UBA5]